MCVDTNFCFATANVQLSSSFASSCNSTISYSRSSKVSNWSSASPATFSAPAALLLCYLSSPAFRCAIQFNFNWWMDGVHFKSSTTIWLNKPIFLGPFENISNSSFHFSLFLCLSPIINLLPQSNTTNDGHKSLLRSFHQIMFLQYPSSAFIFFHQPVALTISATISAAPLAANAAAPQPPDLLIRWWRRRPLLLLPIAGTGDRPSDGCSVDAM